MSSSSQFQLINLYCERLLLLYHTHYNEDVVEDDLKSKRELIPLHFTLNSIDLSAVVDGS